MDRSKLIQIIEKELDELKVLTEEVAASEKDTSLIIEIALSKARLLCQEMELLRELSAKNKPLSTTEPLPETEKLTEEEDEVADESISDPELEIINSEDDIDFGNITLEDDLEEEEEPEEEEEEFIEEEPEFEETEEELIEFGHASDEPVFEEEPAPLAEEIKKTQPTSMREIEFEEEEEIEPVNAPVTPSAPEKPIFREIPKPEPVVTPTPAPSETFVKSQSLNDTIGETKSPESTVTSGSISSLKAAIGLNDRFQFIREIFSNNTEKYNMIIDQLDKLETQQQAVELLKKHLTLQKNETSMKFVELLKRRFAK